MQAINRTPPPQEAPVVALRTGAASRQALALQAGLFLVLFALYWICVRRYIVYDGDMMVRVTKSLVTHHSLRIQDPILHLSEPYSFYGLGVSLLLVPLFVLGQLLFGDGLTLLTLFEPLLTALTVVILMRLLVDLGISWRKSLRVSLLYAFASFAWFFSGVLYSDQLVGLMTTLGVLFALRYTQTREVRWSLACGCALALALLARWDTALLLILPVACYVLYSQLDFSLPLISSLPVISIPRLRGRVREGAFAGLVFSAPILLAASVNVAYDILRYGRPLGGPYGSVVGFTTPLLTGLYGLLLSPGGGLLVFVPLLVLAPFGFRALYRRWPAIALLISGLFLLRLFFYARWGDWDGGSTWATRFMLPVLPLLFILIAFLPKVRWVTVATALLAALSVAIEVLGQLVPYGMYFTRAYAQLSQSPAVQQACGGCSTSSRVEIVNSILDFNLGYSKLVGQFRLLTSGSIDPLWGHLAPVVPIILVVLGVVYVRLRRQAAALDRAALAGLKRGAPPARAL
jgi:hypothetical protein